uniref:Insulin-induced gene protein n=1 Tax=Ursus maritimus TaxID=29073 RepID=A0A452UGA0_URSMA
QPPLYQLWEYREGSLASALSVPRSAGQSTGLSKWDLVGAGVPCSWLHSQRLWTACFVFDVLCFVHSLQKRSVMTPFHRTDLNNMLTIAPQKSCPCKPAYSNTALFFTAVVGLLYPCIDSRLGEPHKFKREWASVMRCVAVFVGINHASAKLDFANNVQLSLTLAALSLGLWWTFDRSRSGLGLGITVAFLATVITQLLVYNGVYQYTSPDFLYIRSWLPCIFFSGGVTVGNIGRQLAMGVPEKPHSD